MKNKEMQTTPITHAVVETTHQLPARIAHEDGHVAPTTNAHRFLQSPML